MLSTTLPCYGPQDEAGLHAIQWRVQKWTHVVKHQVADAFAVQLCAVIHDVVFGLCSRAMCFGKRSAVQLPNMLGA